MKGAIHGIWLNKPGNSIHSAIIPKFSAWAPIAGEADFQVVLWTNTDALTKADIAKLKKTKIIVADPKACKDSPLYKYYLYYFNKGVSGDKAAFAMASDILRIAILDFTAEDKYFIYVDPNDIELFDLKDSLQHLDCRMSNNKFGFAFPIGRPREDSNIFDVRNDVLIAIKNKNLDFFKMHLQAYLANLEKNYQNYKKPINNTEANILVNTISNNTSSIFFKLEQTDVNFISNNRSVSVVTQYADFKESSPLVNSGSYLKFQRVLENGNTWLPNSKTDSLEDYAAINSTINNKFDQGEILTTESVEAKNIFSNSIGFTKKYAHIGIYVLPLLIFLFIFSTYKMIKRRSY